MIEKSTMEPILALRQRIEKYKAVQRDLYMVFIDLEKAYDRVLMKAIWKFLFRERDSE